MKTPTLLLSLILIVVGPIYSQKLLSPSSDLKKDAGSYKFIDGTGPECNEIDLNQSPNHFRILLSLHTMQVLINQLLYLLVLIK